jgi:hypothetical protein
MLHSVQTTTNFFKPVKMQKLCDNWSIFVPIKEENKGKICKNQTTSEADDPGPTEFCICPYTATIEANDVRTTSCKMPSDDDNVGQVQELRLHLPICD